MGLFDKVFGNKSTPQETGVFSYLLGQLAPEMKGKEFLLAYKGWVYACVNAIAEDIGAIEMEFVRKTAKGWVEDETSLVMNLLNSVNPHMSSGELMVATQSFLELDGNAFWYLPRGTVSKKPSEIWLLDPTRVTIVKSKETFVGGYVFQNDEGRKIPISADEILHFKRFNPNNPYRGLGTVQAAALSIDVDNYAAVWNKNFFYNSAVPSAALETSQTLTEEQYNRIKAKWESAYTGVSNAHKLAILSGGLTYKPINLSQKDMQFLEMRKYSRDEIMGIFRVPKTVLGLTEDVNRANAEASEYVFSKRVIKPRMQLIVDRLNEFLLPMFGEDPNKAKIVFEDPVPENEVFELQEKQAAINKWLTVNEIREEDGLQPVQGGDQLYISNAELPIGETTSGSIGQTGKTKSILNEEQLKAMDNRVKYVRSQIDLRTKIFKAIYEEMGKIIVGDLTKSKKKYTKAGEDEYLRVIVNGLETQFAVLGTELKQTYSDVIKHSATTMLARLESDVSFNLANPRAEEFIAQRGLEAVVSVQGTVKEAVKQIVQQGIADGTGAGGIATNIGGYFDESSQFMARRLARTEVVRAYQEGNFEGALTDTSIVGKEWLALSDADEECTQNDNETIPIEAEFQSGDQFPPVHPNCRCDVKYVTADNMKRYLYSGVLELSKRELQAEQEKTLQNIREINAKAITESENIVKEAKIQAADLLNEAKEQAQAEKKGVLKELKALKEKAIGLVYEE